MNEFITSIDGEQLLTAAGFIGYLLYQVTIKDKRIQILEKDRAVLVDKYIASIQDSNNALLETTRIFDSTVQALRK
jgi:hypothetical protein